MKGFVQVASLFGIPLAIVIWYDLITNAGGYMRNYGFEHSRLVANAIHVILAFLCLHTPLHLWRRFNAFSLREFCLTVALACFWVAARLGSSGVADKAVLLKSALIFFIPIFVYFALTKLLFKLCRDDFDQIEGASPNPTQPDNGNA